MKAMELFAFIGEEERPDAPQHVGLKQGLTRAGMIPLVVMDFDRDKLEREGLVAQMQTQANTFGKTIRLARFLYIEDVLVLEPKPNIPTVHVLVGGVPLCGFWPGVPSDWPPGHIWIGLSERAAPPPAGHVMCEKCDVAANLIESIGMSRQ